MKDFVLMFTAGDQIINGIHYKGQHLSNLSLTQRFLFMYLTHYYTLHLNNYLRKHTFDNFLSIHSMLFPFAHIYDLVDVRINTTE